MFVTTVSRIDRKIKFITDVERTKRELEDMAEISIYKGETIKVTIVEKDNRVILCWYSDLEHPHYFKRAVGTFKDCQNLKHVYGLADFDTSETETLKYHFDGCKSLKSLSGIETWDVSKVVNMDQMCRGCRWLESIKAFENWDTRSLETCESMFEGCARLQNIFPLKGLNTSNTKNFSRTFEDTGIYTLDALNNLDTSKAERFDNMFHGCKRLYDIKGAKNWNTKNVKDISYMFYYTDISDLTALADWDVSQCKDFSFTFAKMEKLTSLLGLEKWNTKNVIRLYATFAKNPNLTDLRSVENWETDNLQNVSYLCYFCRKLKDLGPLMYWRPKDDLIVDEAFSETNKYCNQWKHDLFSAWNVYKY